MNKIAIGLAALLMLGAAPAVLAEGAKWSAGATVEADADAGVDVTTTGSVNANYGTLVTGLESNQDIDLSAYSDSSTINCVTVSSLQGNSDAGASLEGALSASEERRVSLQGNIQSNSALWADIQ